MPNRVQSLRVKLGTPALAASLEFFFCVANMRVGQCQTPRPSADLFFAEYYQTLLTDTTPGAMDRWVSFAFSLTRQETKETLHWLNVIDLEIERLLHQKPLLTPTSQKVFLVDPKMISRPWFLKWLHASTESFDLRSDSFQVRDDLLYVATALWILKTHFASEIFEDEKESWIHRGLLDSENIKILFDQLVPQIFAKALNVSNQTADWIDVPASQSKFVVHLQEFLSPAERFLLDQFSDHTMTDLLLWLDSDWRRLWTIEKLVPRFEPRNAIESDVFQLFRRPRALPVHGSPEWIKSVSRHPLIPFLECPDESVFFESDIPAALFPAHYRSLSWALREILLESPALVLENVERRYLELSSESKTSMLQRVGPILLKFPLPSLKHLAEDPAGDPNHKLAFQSAVRRLWAIEFLIAHAEEIEADDSWSGSWRFKWQPPGILVKTDGGAPRFNLVESPAIKPWLWHPEITEALNAIRIAQISTLK